MSGNGGEIERSVEVLGPELHERRRRAADPPRPRRDRAQRSSWRTNPPEPGPPLRRCVAARRRRRAVACRARRRGRRRGRRQRRRRVRQALRRRSPGRRSWHRRGHRSRRISPPETDTSHIGPELGGAEPSRGHPQTDRVGACLVARTGDDVDGHPLQRVAVCRRRWSGVQRAMPCREQPHRCRRASQSVTSGALHQVPGT